MKIVTVSDDKKKSRYALDTVRAVHVVLLENIENEELKHLEGKWAVSVELNPIKTLDAEGKGQVVDFCQFKEWYFDTNEAAEAAISLDTV